MPALGAETVLTIVLFACVIVLPAAVALKNLRTLPSEKEPILRAEFEAYRRYRDEQQAGFKEKVARVEAKAEEHQNAVTESIGRLVEALNSVRCDIAAVAATIKNHYEVK